MRRTRRMLTFVALVVVACLFRPAKAPATIAAQRARLPPPAECQDPVAGIWRSHAFYPSHGQWYIFTLDVKRVPDDPNALTGTVLSHYWSGSPSEEEPPPCRAGGYHQIVRMPADGTANGYTIEFGDTSWELEETFCGPPTTGYYPDRFSGVIDPAIEEFQSVNNDGGPMRDYPTVFRRVECHEGGDPNAVQEGPPVYVQPPSFYPDSGGCDCNLF